MSRIPWFLVAVACLAACVSAPVQEMSDARQAIAAARAAGAAQRAPADLAAAQASLAAAESDLQAQQYSSARAAALDAKRRAATALSVSEHAAETGH